MLEEVKFRLKSFQQLKLTFSTICGTFIWMIRVSWFLLLLEFFGRLRWLRFVAYALWLRCVHPKRRDKKRLSCRHCCLSVLSKLLPQNPTKGVHTLSDSYLLILHLTALRDLRLPARRKVCINLMFLVETVYDPLVTDIKRHSPTLVVELTSAASYHVTLIRATPPYTLPLLRW